MCLTLLGFSPGLGWPTYPFVWDVSGFSFPFRNTLVTFVISTRAFLSSSLRLRVPDTFRDLSLNRAEVNRVINTGSVDYATARMMLWAMDLTAEALPAKPNTRPRRTNNSNVFYYIPLKPLFSQSCIENPSQVPENTRGAGEGVAPHARLGSRTRERVGFPSPQGR